MRPLYLEMTAFGPYADTVRLDMNKLGTEGLYAITGETGAGKTTIFDAIMFALYNRGSGEDREKNTQNLRSKYSDPATETSVTLRFEHRGKEYTVTRKPAQHVLGARGKMVDHNHSVSLICPDADYEKSEVEKKIIEILGVDDKQFEQVVMIAQGQFRQLLRAGSDERQKIFRQIFKTDRFDRFEQQVKEENKRRKEARNQAYNSFRTVLIQMRDSSIQPDLHKALDTGCYESKPELIPTDDFLYFAQQNVEYDRIDTEQTNDVFTHASEKYTAAENALSTGKDQREKRDKLNTISLQKAEQEHKCQDAQNKLDAALQHSDHIEELKADITLIKNSLDSYQDLDDSIKNQTAAAQEYENAIATVQRAKAGIDKNDADQQKLKKEQAPLNDASDRENTAKDRKRTIQNQHNKLEQVQNRIRKLADARRALDEAIQAEQKSGKEADAANKEVVRIEDELELLHNTSVKLADLKNHSKNLEREKEDLLRLQCKHNDYVKACRQLDEQTKTYKEAQEEATKASSRARELRREYNRNIAGLLADTLIEGNPCPVCGNVHHPNPAAHISGAPMLEEVEQAETSAKVLDEAAGKQAQIRGEKKASVDFKHNELAEKLPETIERNWDAAIEGKLTDVRNRISICHDEAKEAEVQEAHRKHLADHMLPNAKKKLQDVKNTVSEAKSVKSAAQSNFDTAQQELNNAAADILPDGWTPESLSALLNKCKEDMDILDKRINQAKKDAQRSIEITASLTQLANDAKELQEKKQSASTKAASSLATSESLISYIKSLRSKLNYQSKAEAEAAIQAKQDEQKRYEDAITVAKKDVESFRQTITGLDGQLKGLHDDLKDTPIVDLDQLQGDFDAAQREKNNAEKAWHTADARYQHSQSLLKNLEKVAEDCKKTDDAFDISNHLLNTVTGNLKDANKVRFEAYVQSAYFERILRYANRRLYEMSREQFEFQRRSTANGRGSAKQGLDLDVVDHANGSVREVSTLSGGEAFLAALALALGMSDEIQNGAAAAVQLDAMFVDEGFGSLSDEFLRLAMDELHRTAESHRLIGIISHVDEVKNEIDRRIEVTKVRGGGSTARLV